MLRDILIAYSGDDPVNRNDPAGLATVGECLEANGELGPLNLVAGGCLTRTIDRSGEDDIGLTGSAGGGLGSGADVSVGLFFEVSNATNLQQLKGQFYYASAGAQVLGGFNAIVFWNSDMSVVGIEVGVSAGLGAEAAVGETSTWVDQFYGIVSANIARGVWGG